MPPPRPAAAVTAGGRRVKAGKRSGPSKELLKQYKLDAKERIKKEEKKSRGGKRNDTTGVALRSLGKGIALVIVIVGVLLAIVYGANVSPREAVNQSAIAIAEIWAAHGTIATGVLCVGAVIAAIGKILFDRQQTAEKEQRLAREKQQAIEARARAKVVKRTTAARNAERLQARFAKQAAQIQAEEEELIRMRAKTAMAEAEAAAHNERITREAALWNEAEQTQLDAALAKYSAAESSSTQLRWENIASDVPGRTAEECLARVGYCRQQAQLLQAEMAEVESEDDGFGDDGFGDDDGASHAEPSAATSNQHASDNDDDDEDFDDVTNDATDDVTDDDEENRERLDIEIEPKRAGTEVAFQQTMLWNIGIARTKQLELQMECARCATPFDATLSGEYADAAEHRTHCVKCATILSVSLRPCFLSNASDILAYIDTDKCRVVDILAGSVLLVSCMSCDEDSELLPFRRGARMETNCVACHKKVALEVRRIDLKELDGGKASGQPQNAKKGGGPSKRSGGPKQRFTEGEPLPDQGGCGHFKKSLRWFRFPCCGKAWPCPVCHETLGDCDGAVNGVLANRVICGKCSHEQTFTNKPCEACNFHMGNRKGGGAHWEGGGGARDVSQLSSKDSRKNKGVSKSGVIKTQSKKNARVGKAGKQASEGKKRT